MEKEDFYELLSRFRHRKGLTQKQLAKPEIGLSQSYIAMLEKGERGFLLGRSRSKPLTRQQVWYLVQELELWPPDCDRFLESAGHSTDRSLDEEKNLQERTEVQELWIFARFILDPDPAWYDVVVQNLLKGVAYRYFTSNDAAFQSLLQKLSEKNIPDQIIQDRLECNLLPIELFLTNFAIYNPGRNLMYGCGTKSEYGRARRFYTMHDSEVQRLYEILYEWRQRLSTQSEIRFSDARRVYPSFGRSRFGANE